MGMFDHIDFEMNCPVCGSKLKDFQSKDGPCMLETISPLDVFTFYDCCKKCNTWVEFNKKPTTKKLTLNEVMELFDIHVKISNN